MARPSKKPKPTFDVARDPIVDSKSGWVYRSQEIHEPVVHEPLEPHEPFEPREPFEPPQPFEPRESPEPRSWLATGVYLMILPVQIGMSIMLAPVSWLLGTRSRR